MEDSNINRLEQVTNQITSNLKYNIEIGSGEVLKTMTDFHDTQDMVIVVVAKEREDDSFRTIHINQFAVEKMKRYGADPNDFIVHCLGNHPKYEGCPMHSECSAHKVWREGQYVFERDVKGSLSGDMYDVLLFPLKFNGTKAVVEFWIPQERNGCD